MTAMEVLEEQRRLFPASDAEMEAMPSEMTDCIFELRPIERRPLFYIREDGWGKIFLDGYAVIPVEVYENLKKRAEANQ